MLRTSLDNISKTKASIAALAILLCLVLGLFFSTVVIVLHSGHEHDQDSVDGACTICVQLHNAENVLKQIKAAAGGIAFLFPGLFSVIAIILASLCLFECNTLVRLKIRINC